MEAPFFLVAHAVEKARGSTANGFSESYRIAIAASTMVYGVVGLWITYRVLRRRFSPQVTGICTALLLLGTNVFWFVLHQQGMAHVPLFFLMALLMHLTTEVHEKSHWSHFGGIGLIAGLITIIRPVDGLCVLIPLCYGVGQPWLRAKLAFLLKHWAGVLLAGVCFLLPIIPQLLYWKWLTGYSVYDSYGPGQGFDFRHPHIWQGLFGASNGWLFYTPLMILALTGFLRWRRIRPFAMGMILFLMLYVWAIYSWYLPNYPNGLGSRPMVDAYALLALPLVAALEWLSNARRMLRITGMALIAACVAIDLSYTVQEATASSGARILNMSITSRRPSGTTCATMIWWCGIPASRNRIRKSCNRRELFTA